MSFTFNGLTATVTISGSVTATAVLPAPASTQTIVNQKDATSRSYTLNTWITAISYTVTTAKTLYLTDVWAIIPISGSSQRATWSLYDGTNILAAGVVQPIAANPSPPTATSVNSFNTPISIAAGTVLLLRIYSFETTSSFVVACGFNGFEVTA